MITCSDCIYRKVDEKGWECVNEYQVLTRIVSHEERYFTEDVQRCPFHVTRAQFQEALAELSKNIVNTPKWKKELVREFNNRFTKTKPETLNKMWEQ